MKITAKQIQKGMTIKVASIYDSTQALKNQINGVFGWGTSTLEEKAEYQKRLDEGRVLSVGQGSIKKDSPIVNVYDIDLNASWSYYSNGRVVTYNYIVLKTDKGDLKISTRQKVKLYESE